MTSAATTCLRPKSAWRPISPDEQNKLPARPQDMGMSWLKMAGRRRPRRLRHGHDADRVAAASLVFPRSALAVSAGIDYAISSGAAIHRAGAERSLILSI